MNQYIILSVDESIKANWGTICTLVLQTVVKQNRQVRHILGKSLRLSVAASRKRERLMSKEQ